MGFPNKDEARHNQLVCDVCCKEQQEDLPALSRDGQMESPAPHVLQRVLTRSRKKSVTTIVVSEVTPWTDQRVPETSPKLSKQGGKEDPTVTIDKDRDQDSGF